MTTDINLEWKCRDTTFSLGPMPLLMGILNVTPDSFSDGGRFLDHGKAVERALEMLDQGADIIDVGGESTRPGASPVDAKEECARIIPVIRELVSRMKAVVSVDTMKAAVARQALEAGARIINDVSALTFDPGMAQTAAESGAGVILMHMKGSPRTMQADPRYDDVVSEVREYLAARADDLTGKGLSRNRLAVDPGIGFGKTVDHNLRLIAEIEKIKSLGMPVAVGLSRKSFLGKLTGKNVEDRLAASISGVVFCVLKGVHVLRVHDVGESRDAARVAYALKSGQHNAG